jgi:L,D-transpeptidase YcbB
MKDLKTSYRPSILIIFLIPLLLLAACTDDTSNEHHQVGEKEVVTKPEDINAMAEQVIRGTLKDILQNNRKINDSFKINNAIIVQYLYEQHSFQPIWSSKGRFNNIADSLFDFITGSKKYGLFPEDYSQAKVNSLRRQLILDTSREKRLDASLWAYEDMLLTSSFIQVVKDLKIGRLQPDSVVLKDTILTPPFFLNELKYYERASNAAIAKQLEPQSEEYHNLEEALQFFLSKANFKSYTLVSSPDSLKIPKLLYKRLGEEDSSLLSAYEPDSMDVALAIKKYQRGKHLKPDGKISPTLISQLNDNDKERFIRIAINLDRYKQLPPMPNQYIWVNLPSYYLQLKDSDSVVLKSRIVIGKPDTRTPIITSAISNMITYPQWHIPESIIKKEVLPGLKNDPSYTLSKGLSLLDDNGNEVDPYLVDWSKFKNSIPYDVVQGSGDENALGILKFNFPNKYSVYLHDTNQRYLFSKKTRALSHGCVRVQAWQELAKFILRNDSIFTVKATPIDSLKSWLALKQKHYIPIHKQIPLFIRYITCEVNKGNLIFYEDIYGEDLAIREKTFANK